MAQAATHPTAASVWLACGSQSARTSFLRFGATRSFLTHCTFRPTACSRLFFLTRSFFYLQVAFFEEKKSRSFVSEVNTYINRFGQVNLTVLTHARLYEF
jgi:hypothetical protein